MLRHHGKCSVPGTAKQADHGKPDKATQLRSEGPSDDPSRRYCGTAEWNQATTTLPVHVPFQQYSVTERGGARYTITVLIKERSCLKKSNAGRHRQGVRMSLEQCLVCSCCFCVWFRELSWVAPNPPNRFCQIANHCSSESNFNKHPGFTLSLRTYFLLRHVGSIKMPFVDVRGPLRCKPNPQAFAQLNIVVQIRFV